MLYYVHLVVSLGIRPVNSTVSDRLVKHDIFRIHQRVVVDEKLALASASVLCKVGNHRFFFIIFSISWSFVPHDDRLSGAYRGG